MKGLASRKECRLVSRRSCMVPELFLRWSSHSMSSCDGVRPIVIGAGADLPEGVTYIPREGSCQPTLHRATIPTTGGQSTQEPSYLESSGITFQLPCGMDVGPLSKLSCRARLCLLVAVARLAGRWCFWRLLVFLAGQWVSGCFVSLFEGADPRTGARGLASRKECRQVSRRSCSVQNIL